MNLVNDIEQNTNTIFVGELIGASPNHYGETLRAALPNSGIEALYSSLFWQDFDPRDDRPWIEPKIPVALSSKNYITKDIKSCTESTMALMNISIGNTNWQKH